MVFSSRVEVSIKISSPRILNHNGSQEMRFLLVSTMLLSELESVTVILVISIRNVKKSIVFWLSFIKYFFM